MFVLGVRFEIGRGRLQDVRRRHPTCGDAPSTVLLDQGDLWLAPGQARSTLSSLPEVVAGKALGQGTLSPGRAKVWNPRPGQMKGAGLLERISKVDSFRSAMHQLFPFFVSGSFV